MRRSPEFILPEYIEGQEVNKEPVQKNHFLTKYVDKGQEVNKEPVQKNRFLTKCSDRGKEVNEESVQENRFRTKNVDRGQEVNVEPVQKNCFLIEHVDSSEEVNEEPVRENQQIDEVDQMLNNLRGVCPTCDKRFLNDEILEKHVEKFHKRFYKCNLCPKTYVKSFQLQMHKKTHTEFFKCSECKVKLLSLVSLKRHRIRWHSTDEKNFTCDYCGKQYRFKSDIFIHIKNAHSTSRKICHICGQSVKSVYLTCHLRKHVKNSKKFSCHLCRGKFATQTNLDNHLLLHEEVFHCKECGRDYKGRTELKRHKRMHMDNIVKEECKICRKMIAKLHLRTHILTHAGLRPYKCDICKADFTQRSSLTRHRKSHPGALPPPPSVSIKKLVENVLQLYS